MPYAKRSLFASSLLTAAAAFTASPADAEERVRLQCEAEGAGDISMDASFERRRNGLREFDVEFEAAPNGDFSARQRMTVFVDDVRAGVARLRKAADGDIEGDLDLDDRPDPDEMPFPARFPQVERGTRVVVATEGKDTLACRLR